MFCVVCGAASLIKGIKEVEEMLLFNIAQAQMNERGNYGESASFWPDIIVHGRVADTATVGK